MNASVDIDYVVNENAADPVQAGTVLAGKYRVGERLATGGMGVVHAGSHLELGQTVAIKFVRADHAADGEVLRRFLDEARIAASLRGEHIAKVLDAGWMPSGIPYFVMEHLEGQDLSMILHEGGKLPIHEAVRHAMATCEALEEAHARGLIHRDVKPENLFLAEYPNGKRSLKLLDFGVSARFGAVATSRRMTQAGKSVGSPSYMSPEQMTTPDDTDQRTDIWSLGVVLYELLTGLRAFDGPTVPAICSAVLSQDPPPVRAVRSEVSPALERIVMKCLEKDREKRFASVTALAEALGPYAEPIEESVASQPMTSEANPVAVIRDSEVPVFDDVPVDSRDIPKSSLFPRTLAVLATLALLGVAGYAYASQPDLSSLSPKLGTVGEAEIDPAPPFVLGVRGAIPGPTLAAEPEVERTETTTPVPQRVAPPSAPLSADEIAARKERYREWIQHQGLTPLGTLGD
ncbi:MAG: serine/threonine protein kinase [Myxococcales bacterium]|nr:serine/threonine protein kinase [Myxococcales bacterium]MCB9575487.1 serine/threonine protein kinase [Polyangiaceae bacterium]